MKTLILAGVIALLSALQLHASYDSVQVVTKTDSMVIKGRLIHDGSTEIIVRLNEDKVRTIRRTDIVTIDRFRTSEAGEVVDTRYKRQDNFFTAGVTIGSPAGLNLRIGKHINNLAFDVSGMYLSTVQGAQFNIHLCYDNEKATQNYIGLMVGSSAITGDLENTGISRTYTYTYGGVSTALHSHGFFLETGLVIGSGDFRSPQVMFQIGYMPKF
ncbi:MAG: hypothetical protein K1X91_15735 [Bacteriodetes bacterium]|nr:hypothetical protein [Bacteroidota bacterium]